MIRVLDIIEDTMVDGPGFRTSIYCAGCRHKCPGCHNPQSWDFKGGREMTTEEIMKIIVADPYDTTDHNQDGYGVYGAERFLYNFTFYNFFEGGELNDMCFLVAKPA